MGGAVRVADAGELFAEFYAAHAPRVAGLARRLVARLDDVDDVVQETLLRAYRANLHSEDRDPWPWLARVVRNLCCDASRVRTRHHVVTVPDTLDWSSTAADGVDVTVEHRARAGYVAAALHSLPERDRELLLLHHVDEIPCVDIAAAERHSVQAIKSALARARTAFRRTYDGWRGMVPGILGGGATRLRAGVIALGLALGLAAPPGVAKEPPAAYAPESESVTPAPTVRQTRAPTPIVSAERRLIDSPPPESDGSQPSSRIAPAVEGEAPGSDGSGPASGAPSSHVEPPRSLLPLDVGGAPSLPAYSVPPAVADAAAKAREIVDATLASAPDPASVLPV